MRRYVQLNILMMTICQFNGLEGQKECKKIKNVLYPMMKNSTKNQYQKNQEIFVKKAIKIIIQVKLNKWKNLSVCRK